MANIQQFNVIKYGRSYLSPLLRKERLIAYLSSLLTPVQEGRDNLSNVIYPDIERRTRYNSQVRKFEVILNTIFNTGNQIYIDEAGVAQHVYTYNENELQPLFLYNEAEGEPATFTYYPLEFIPLYDFTVHVPQSLYNSQLPRVKAEVAKRAIAGVTWNIVPI